MYEIPVQYWYERLGATVLVSQKHKTGTARRFILRGVFKLRIRASLKEQSPTKIRRHEGKAQENKDPHAWARRQSPARGAVRESPKVSSLHFFSMATTFVPPTVPKTF